MSTATDPILSDAGELPKLDCSELILDAELAMALMTTEHPSITAFGKAIHSHLENTNALLKTCAPWQEALFPPAGALSTFRLAQERAQLVLKEVERLDSIDLDDLNPSWGDRQTVRMARKSSIAASQLILDRLDAAQAFLKVPAARIKQKQDEAAAAKTAASGVKLQDMSFREKYREKLLARPAPTPSTGVIGPSLPKRGRKMPASKADVETILKRVQAKTGWPAILRQPMRAFYKRLADLAGVSDLAMKPSLCKDAVACMVCTAQCALESAPSSKVLGKVFYSLQELEALKDNSDLPGILLDMADAVRTL